MLVPGTLSIVCTPPGCARGIDHTVRSLVLPPSSSPPREVALSRLESAGGRRACPLGDPFATLCPFPVALWPPRPLATYRKSCTMTSPALPPETISGYPPLAAESITARQRAPPSWQCTAAREEVGGASVSQRTMFSFVGDKPAAAMTLPLAPTKARSEQWREKHCRVSSARVWLRPPTCNREQIRVEVIEEGKKKEKRRAYLLWGFRRKRKTGERTQDRSGRSVAGSLWRVFLTAPTDFYGQGKTLRHCRQTRQTR